MYNSDGVRVWRQDALNQQEYRYVCRIGCGGIPMRVYNRAIGGTSWNTLEEYMETPTVIGYTKVEGTFGHYVWTSGHWLGDWVAGGVGADVSDARGAYGVLDAAPRSVSFGACGDSG
ncbi:MAG: hypothetical protein KatS3mg019_0051 [Fimbriimonadales bacterium]|nr:MAG: hypothetical protein KatS3mg019_0051 [Fimbriimonadales bacterium]